MYTAVLKEPYPFDVKSRRLVAVAKRGHWKIANPIGLECPFCGGWRHLPVDICPKCGALLSTKK